MNNVHRFTDTDTDTSSWRSIFANFLAEASAALVEPYFFLLQSNGWKSLCLLTGLSPEVYSALLLECKLVWVKVNNDVTTRSVIVEHDNWKYFLESYNLRGNNGRGSCTELSKGWITKAAIARSIEGEKIINLPAAKNMYVLRIGMVVQGEKPPSCTAINNDKVEPPGMNHTMKMAKMKLSHSTIELQTIQDDSKLKNILTVRD